MLLPAEHIRARVAELGRQISSEHAGDDLLLVSVLKGGIVFLSDLMRAITVPHEIDFLSVSSYGDATQSSGRVRLLHDLSQEISGRHLLIVEDIIDTGRTLAYLLDYLRLRNTASIRVCALVQKEIPTRRVSADLVGFTIPNRYVIGYGMDLAGHYRHLPFIGAIPDHLAASFANGINP
ncbi:MAG: hypoxanthine phosphoribosyltransferase [Candidatus Eiseniibacteriota bacterium]